MADDLNGVVHARKGSCSIALSPELGDELAEHYRRTAFKGEAEFVFCHPERGTRYSEKTWAERFQAAREAAGISDYVRPFHDLRHTALTNEAAAGSSPIALMAKAGHSDMKTTRIYLHLAGPSSAMRPKRSNDVCWE